MPYWNLILEWYPWSTFSEIQEIGQGGYGTVFRAKRRVQRIEEWDYQKKEWNRFQKDNYYYKTCVALKTIKHSESTLKDFLTEVIIFIY